MNRIKEYIKPLSLMLTIPMMTIVYLITNHFSTRAHNVTIGLDGSIPFLKIFIIPYIAWYLFIPVTLILLCIKDRKAYYKTLLIYNLGFAIGCVTFALFQTTLQRPALIGDDILTRIVAFIYAHDKPLNCLPSIHVFTSYLMIRAVSKSALASFKTNAIISAISLTIILSTLFTKQHVILDAFTGMILVEALVFTVNKLEGKVHIQWLEKTFAYFSLKHDLETE